MKVIQDYTNPLTILKMYETVYDGYEMVTRGQSCTNVRNLAIVLDASQPIITNFKARNLNLNYAKKEWLWYIGADKFDSSIEQHASMWQKLKQPDGSYFSNYGQYIFGNDSETGKSQFQYVVECLLRDTNSRRASMVLLDKNHLFIENVDTVCTYAINFTIENNKLHMTVMMRSNDVIFGFTNDAFCFWNLYQFVYQVLNHYMGGNLLEGTYTHMANSMHVYERHYKMINKIINDSVEGYTPIDVPRLNQKLVEELIISKGKNGTGEYFDWLTAV
jgi:thymidylate synthase